jgi:hypothetical protein
MRSRTAPDAFSPLAATAAAMVPLAKLLSKKGKILTNLFSDFLDPDPHWESGSRTRIQEQES